MKLFVSHSKTDSPWQVIVPDSVCQNPPAVGEYFSVEVSKGTEAPKKLQACYLADGRSLLIGNDVVRVSSNVVVKKCDNFRMSLSGEGKALLPYSVTSKIVRPVEPKKTAASMGGGDLKSPMTGKIISVLAADGAVIKEGETLLIIEAMKMENRILAECTGTVKGIRVEPGKTVSTGDLLLTLIPQEQA